MKVCYALFAVSALSLLAAAGYWLHLDWLFGIALPYTAGIVFLLGIIYRVIGWASAPVPFHIPTVSGQQKSLAWIKANNVESPSNNLGLITRIALEVLVFRSLFRNERMEFKGNGKLIYGGNRYLWLGGLAFHWALLVIIFRHLRFATEPVLSIIVYIQQLDGFFQLALPTLYMTDIIILIALAYLFFRRVAFSQLRYISLTADYFALSLILAVAISGILMRSFFRVDLIAVKQLAMGVLTFHPVVPEGIGLAFYVHLSLVSTLIAYFPFSKMMHSAGVLFSPTRNLKNNSRAKRHVNAWDYPVKVHTYDEWENEFREALKDAGLPLESE